LERPGPIIEVDHLTKVYGTLSGRPILALRDVSIRVFPQQFVSVVGSSGCGKSTLLKLIAGLIPATRGEGLPELEEALP
jgi:NitT/TauT family transport system ATP-binding protein